MGAEQLIAWMIERSHLVTGLPLYWGGRGSCDWSFEANDGVRFVRQEDAERVASWLRMGTEHINATAVAREHAWVGVEIVTAGTST